MLRGPNDYGLSFQRDAQNVWTVSGSRTLTPEHAKSGFDLESAVGTADSVRVIGNDLVAEVDSLAYREEIEISRETNLSMRQIGDRIGRDNRLPNANRSQPASETGAIAATPLLGATTGRAAQKRTASSSTLSNGLVMSVRHPGRAIWDVGGTLTHHHRSAGGRCVVPVRSGTCGLPNRRAGHHDCVQGSDRHLHARPAWLSGHRRVTRAAR